MNSVFVAMLRKVFDVTGLPQKQAAVELGIMPQTVSRVLCGGVDKPQRYTAKGLASVALRELYSQANKHMAEAERLRRIGAELKKAYVYTYGPIEKEEATWLSEPRATAARTTSAADAAN